MLHRIFTAMVLMAVAGPVVAECATAGLRTRCIYVGPNADTTIGPAATGARVVTVPQARVVPQRRLFTKAPPPVVPTNVLDKGDQLPEDVLILMNPLRYGLPRPQDGWAYFKFGDQIYRADISTRRVLNYVNPHINRY